MAMAKERFDPRKERFYTFLRCDITGKWQWCTHGWVIWQKCKHCGAETGYEMPEHWKEVKKILGPAKFAPEWCARMEEELNSFGEYSSWMF